MQLYESEERLQFILKIDFFLYQKILKNIVLIDDRIFSKKMNESEGYLFFFPRYSSHSMVSNESRSRRKLLWKNVKRGRAFLVSVDR